VDFHTNFSFFFFFFLRPSSLFNVWGWRRKPWHTCSHFCTSLEAKWWLNYSIISLLSFHTVENSRSVSQNLTLDRIDKVKHYIRIKTHNIVVRFWGKSGVKCVICVRLMLYNHIKLQSQYVCDHNSYGIKYNSSHTKLCETNYVKSMKMDRRNQFRSYKINKIYFLLLVKKRSSIYVLLEHIND